MSISTQEVLKYVNLARQYPKYYVALIDEQINSFSDQFNIQLQEDILYETIEGKNVWEEAKTFLINQEPLRPLDHHQGLSKAAADHARDIVKTSSSGHQGSDGSTFIDRIQRYCKKGKGSMIELLGTTHLIPGKNSIELAMLNLIIDDGVNNRGHRKALFSNDYRHIGVDFIVSQDKIYSVIAMSQSNIQIIKQTPQSIATSTSHLKTMTELTSDIKETASMGHNTRENIIDEPESRPKIEREPIRMSKSQACQEKPSEPVWTLKNVNNEQKVYSKKSVNSRQQIEQNEPLSVEPSIFREVENSVRSVHSKNSICDSVPSTQKVCDTPDPKEEKRVSNRQPSSKCSVKESSLKSSQQSIKSEKKQNQGYKGSNFGLASKVQEYKLKSSFNSPFLKSNTSTSGFGSTVGGKKVVEKKQIMRSWNQDQFLVKEITTIVKYEDGTVEDLVEKHSVLRTTSNSYIKDATL